MQRPGETERKKDAETRIDREKKTQRPGETERKKTQRPGETERKRRRD